MKKSLSSNYLKIGQAAKALGVSIDTLRRWEKSGKITATRTPGGTRLYSLQSLRKVNPQATIFEQHQTGTLSTEELLRLQGDALEAPFVIASEVSEARADALKQSSPVDYPNQIAAEPEAPRNDDFKRSFVNKFLIGSAVLSAITLTLTSWITASYLTQPKATQQFLKNNIASGLLKPFQTLAEGAVIVISPNEAKQLGFIPSDESPPIPYTNVLATTSAPRFLEVNSDTQINGSLYVRDQINNATLEGTPSANTVTLASGDTTLTITKSATIDQDISTTSSPKFAGLTTPTLNLSATKNQIVFQSGGPTGTLTWTPTGSAKIITLPDATTTLVGKDTTDTLTNKSMSGSSNTFTNIPNSALVNKKVTVTAGTNLTGGGDVELGSSITISAKASPSFSGVVLISDGTAAAPGLAFTDDTDTGLYRIGTNKIALITGGTSTQGISIDSSGNVGVGTITPTTRLHVVGTGNITSNVTIGGTLGVTDATTLSSTLGVTGNSTFGTNTLFVNTTTGNVGVGTTTPNYTLHVAGNVGVDNSLTVGSAGVFNSTLSVSGNITNAGVYLSSDGTASAPSYSFTQDTNTGIFRPGNHALGFTTGGTSKMSITNAGNVGIGITSPANLLDVAGAQAIGSGYAGVYTAPTNGLLVQGNVGIGTSAPGAALEVNGNVILGNTASQTIIATGVFSSNIIADGQSTRSIGSSSVRWPNGYFTNLDATNISGTVVTGSTTAATWTINSDNTTNNAELAALAFETGSGSGANFNAVLQWNASGDVSRVSGFDNYNLFNFPVAIFSQVSGGNQTFTSGSLFKYSQPLAHAITQSGAFIGGEFDFSSNITVPNSSSGNQTGVKVTLSDAGAAATTIGYQTAGTSDYGLYLQGETQSYFSGNVGIGASLPQAKLIVQGNVGIGYTGANQAIPVNGLAVSGNVGIGITTANSTLSVAGNAHIGSLAQGIVAPANGLFVDGNVGIGATTSSNILDVWGNARITGTLTVDSNITGPTTGSIGYFSRTTNPVNLVYPTTITDTIGTYGNLGIGTTNPIQAFTLSSTSGTAEMAVQSKAGSQAVIDFYDGSTLKWQIGKQTDNSLFIYDNATGLTPFSFTSSGSTSIHYVANKGYSIVLANNGNAYLSAGGGNVGIGTQSPGSMLGVVGNVGIGVSFGTKVTPVNGLAVEGNVGIGTTTANSTLSVNGNAHIGSLAQGIVAPTNGLFVDGNVGIGATTSSNILDVWGNARITGTLNVDQTSTFGGNLTLSNGQFLAPNGTFSLPSYSFTNSTSTGLYSPSANALALQTNGAATPPLTITAGGNIGIGVTNPVGALQVNGAAAIGYGSIPTSSLSSNGLAVSGNVGIGTTSASANLYNVGTTQLLGNSAIGNVTVNTSRTLFVNQLYTDPSADFYGTFTSVSGLATSGANSNRIVALRAAPIIDASNTQNWTATNIGMIGLLARTANLSTTGNSFTVTGSAGIYVENASAMGSGTITNQFGIYIEPLSAGVNNYALVTAPGAGNVGIGVTSPIFAFQVNSGANTTFINSSGNLGIGATTSSNKLDVWGNARVTGTLTVDGSTTLSSTLSIPDGTAAAPGLNFSSDTDTGLWRVGTNLLALTTNGSGSLQSGTTINGLSVNANGNVGIGTTSPNNTIQVVNLINFNNSATSTYLGFQAGTTNTSSQNTAVGYQALSSATAAANNTALGYQALKSTTTAANNVAIGDGALFTNQMGGSNTAVGYQAMYSSNRSGVGGDNTAVGYQALYSNTEGLSNAGLGEWSLYSNTTGSNNVAVGLKAGYTSNSANANTTGSNNTFIGDSAGPASPTQLTNATALGNAAVVGCSNCLVLGSINGANGATSSVNVGIGTSNPIQRFQVNFDTANPFVVTSGGNVGIGFTSPAAKLHISAAAGTTGLLLDNDVWIGGKDTTGAVKNLVRLFTDNNVYYNSGVDMVFRPGDVERVRFVSGGNVGIGFSSPDRLLQLALDANPAGTNASLINTAGTTQLSLTGSTASGLAKKLVLGIDTTDNYGVIQAGNTSGTNYALSLNPAGGNVGIGTTSPGVLLDISGGETRILSSSTLSVATSGKGLELRYRTDSGLDQGEITSYDRSGSGTKRLLIDGNPLLLNFNGGGSVGVGYAGDIPNAKLAVNGNLGIGTSSTSQIFQVNTSASGNAFVVTSGGNVGIGFTSPTGARLAIYGGAGTGGLKLANGATIPGENATAGYLDFLNGQMRFFSQGTDNSTRGTYTFQARTANQTSEIAVLSSLTNGNLILEGSNVGNVGIGLSSPLSRLGVGGNVGIGTSYGWYAAPVNGLAVEGNVGIGLTTANSQLSVANNVHIGSLAQGTQAPTNGLFVDGTVLIGPTATDIAGRGARFFFQPTGVANQVGLELLDIGDTTATSDITALHITAQTAAAAYTVSGVWGIDVRSPNLGIGSSVTSAYGVRIMNQGTANTANAYGLYINSQTGSPTSNYSIYSAGGLNYFADNVGIGATTSTNKLDVWGNARITGTLTVDQGTTFGGNLTLSGHLLPNTDDTYDLGSNTQRWRDLYLGPGTLHIGTSTSDEYALSYDTTNNRLGFNVNDSGPAEIVFDSSGNVGIGTSGPTSRLEVAGSFTTPNSGSLVNISGTLTTGTNIIALKVTPTIEGSVGSGVWGMRLTNWTAGKSGQTLSDIVGLELDNPTFAGTTATNQYMLYLDTPTRATNNFAIYSTGGISYFAGNVGIGFTSPDRLLQLAANADPAGTNASLINTAGTTQLSLTGSTANTLSKKLVLGIDTTDNYGVIQAGNTSGANYDISLNPAGGNVGIGITSPIQLFQINYSSANPFVVTSGGNVGIGFTSPAQLLDVRGGGLDTAGFIMTANSDATNLIALGSGRSGDNVARLVFEDSSTNFAIGTVTNSGLTGLNTLLTLTPAGNLTVNAATSGVTLTVSGTTTLTGAVTLSSTLTLGGTVSANSNIIEPTGRIGMGGGSTTPLSTVVTTSGLYLQGGNSTDINGAQIILWGRQHANASRLDISTPYDAAGSGLSSRLQITGNVTTATATFQNSNVGIGATVPDRQLQINSDINITSSNAGLLGAGGTQFSITGSSTTTSPKKLVLGIDTTDNYGVIQAGNSDGTNYALSLNPAGGNVGIGTTSPATPLQISAATAGVRITSTTGTNMAYVHSQNTGGFVVTGIEQSTGGGLTTGSSAYAGVLSHNGAYPLQFGTNNAVRMTIDSTGNVGIGFTSPLFTFQVNSGPNTTFINSSGNLGVGATTSDNKLDVWGNARITGTLTLDSTSTFGNNLTLSSGQFLAPNGTSSLPSYSFTNSTSTGLFSPSANALALNTNGASTPPLTITAGGNVGIGTTSPGYALDIVGNSALWQSVYGTDDGLVLYMPFSEGTGSTTYDRSPYGNDGTLTPGAGGTNTTAEQMWDSGKYGNAIEIDQTDDSVIVPDSSSLKVGNNLTIEAWFKLNFLDGSHQTIVAKGVNTGYELDIVNNKLRYFGTWGGVYITGATTLTTGVWYHVVASATGTSGNIYLNGVLDAQGTVTAAGDATGEALIIGGRTSGALPLKGFIDEVKIYNRAISADEIKAHYLRGENNTAVSVAGSAGVGSTAAGNFYGLRSVVSDTTAITTGTDNTYGSRIDATRTGATGGTINTYGQYIALTADNAGAGTSNSYGLYVDTSGSTADNNYGAYFSGNVGIGFTSPAAKLHVVDPSFTGVPTGATIAVFGSTDGTTTGVSIRARGTVTGALADFGEYFPFVGLKDDYAVGDLVSNTTGEPVSKTDGIYQSGIRGVVTKASSFIAGADENTTYDEFGYPTNRLAVALLGRVQLKVSTENGLIKVGDFLTSSSTPGVAMKATKPGQVVGKALENYDFPDPNIVGKILVFVNVSFADPGNFLASLSLDSDGNLIIPKIRTASIILDPSVASASAQLTADNGQLALNSDPSYVSTSPQLATNSNTAVDLNGKLAALDETIVKQQQKLRSLEERLAALEATQSATPSAVIASEAKQSSSSGQIATGSATPRDDIASLNLTPPDILLASSSAQLAVDKLSVQSEATVSGQLLAYQAVIQDNFKVFGDTTIGNTIVAGHLTVDGTLSIENGNEINVIGTLYLQKGLLADKLDIFNGQVTIDKDGKLSAKTIVADQFKVNEGKSAGTGKILAGQTEVVIENPLVEENSIVLITPNTPLAQTLGVTERKSKTTTTNASFTIQLVHPEPRDISFDYLIIGQQKISQSNTTPSL